MAEDNPNRLPSENENIENDEFEISSTTYTGRELQIFSNNNNDNNTNNNNNTMMVSIQNCGESSQNLSLEVTSTSSTLTTRVIMNRNQILTPDEASSDIDYESDFEYSDVDNDDRDDTSPDSQDNSNNNSTQNESDVSTDSASSCEEIDSTSKPITDEDGEKENRKRTIKSDMKPKKRFKNDDNIPDI